MTKQQQKQFAPWFVIGFIGNWTFLAPIHEVGHWIMGILEGSRPVIVSFNATAVDFISLPNLLFGPVWELSVWSFLLYCAYRFSWSSGWHGLIWANVLSGYFLTPFTSDLCCAQHIWRAYGLGWVSPYFWWIYSEPILAICFGSIRDHLRKQSRKQSKHKQVAKLATAARREAARGSAKIGEKKFLSG